jgi:hypothetical protein
MDGIKRIMLLLLSIASLWDGFTTVTGTLDILGIGWPQLLASITFSLVILGFLIGTAKIFDTDESGVAYCIMRILWWFGLSYDLYTSYLGNKNFVLGGYIEGNQILILIGLTVFVSSSPILISVLFRD